jgi:hypothetical protein
LQLDDFAAVAAAAVAAAADAAKVRVKSLHRVFFWSYLNSSLIHLESKIVSLNHATMT